MKKNNPLIVCMFIVVIFSPCDLIGQSLFVLVENYDLTVNSGSTVSHTINAPVGYKVVSGGWETSGGSHEMYVPRSLPANGDLNAWVFEFRNGGTSTSTVNTFLICLRDDLGPDLSGLGDENHVRPTFELEQNYPNPFNPVTNIKFSLENRVSVKLEVFNIEGQALQTVFEGVMPAGNYQMKWDGKTSTGSTAPSGTYLYRLTCDGFEKTKKMLVLK